MPLRQSTLKFASASSTTDVTKIVPLPLEGRSRRSVSLGSSDIGSTMIISNTSTRRLQLPTPSETTNDVSSQSSDNTPTTSTLPRSRPKRNTNSHGSMKDKSTARSSAFTEEMNRSISGETLVSSASQHTESRKSSKNLDEPWNMTAEFMTGSKTELVKDQSVEDEDKSITMNDEEEEEEEVDEAELARLQAARKLKAQQSAAKWEERRKAAEQNATRRSKRSSLLEKAGDLVSDIAITVLGKRSRDEPEKSASRSSLRPRGGATNDTTAASASSTSVSSPKRPRTSFVDMIDQDDTVVAPKKVAPRTEKKWLAHGLYAGQPRMFDGRLTEEKNKRKSTRAERPKENSILPLPMFAGERLLKQGRDFKLPFDVFSPLPAGQPKPDEWRKTNKNVFVGDAAQEWRTSKFIEHSTCLCRQETGCDQDCMNRYMYYECDSRNCNLSDQQCGNRAFDGLKDRAKKGGKYNVGVEVIKTADRGYGVRSNRTFDANQIIVEYTGEIITQEECEHRMHTEYKDNECYYLMLFDQNMIIDATRGSIARFVNHSCEPNCRMEKWTVGGKPRMALFAGDRGVMTGEELTYDYNFDPFSQKNVQECRCGAPNCRGILGPKPKPAKKMSPETDNPKHDGKKAEGKLGGAKRKIADVLEESTNRLNKKRKVMNTKSPKSSAKSPPSKVKPAKSKVVLVKKATARKVSMPKATNKIGRSDSKLKKIISDAKKVTNGKGRRATSSTSAREALLPKQKSAKTVKRASSLKEKAKKMVHSVKEGSIKRSRSVRTVG